ncbi:MPT63 family protein [Mycobacterium sp. NAZ190054]|uniref:MPT63 family protein n=1 Tax=Mycobacterium sp. NAZ190054 TaxID=1747766 RepID=UPI00351031C8
MAKSAYEWFFCRTSGSRQRVQAKTAWRRTEGQAAHDRPRSNPQPGATITARHLNTSVTCYFARGEAPRCSINEHRRNRVRIKPALIAGAAAAATAAAFAGAAVASAEPEVKYLGQPGELVNGNVVQQWTITDLKPSSDVIPYQPVGTLWEATATDEAISGSVIPIVSNLNARAKNGDTYRVLFGVATPQGVNPSTLAQGQKTTGKIYFDVTGEQPDSVFYSDGGPDVVLWLEAPPAPATGSTGSGSSSSYGSQTSPSVSGAADAATAETTETPASAADPAAEAAVPAEPAPAATPDRAAWRRRSPMRAG